MVRLANLIRPCAPLVGWWVTTTVVELDKKGRALLPAPLRKKVGVRRFEVRLEKGRIELIPIQGCMAVKGKYRNRLKTPWAKLEERAEKLVRDGKR